MLRQKHTLGTGGAKKYALNKEQEQHIQIQTYATCPLASFLCMSKLQIYYYGLTTHELKSCQFPHSWHVCCNMLSLSLVYVLLRVDTTHRHHVNTLPSPCLIRVNAHYR